MKKIINGFRYDTEKATLIGQYHTPGLGKSDFRYWEAGLYKSPRSGRYFLAGEGHAMTRFAAHTGDGSSWGEKLLPLERDEALDWAERYLDTEVIEEHFGDMIKEPWEVWPDDGLI